MTVTSFFWTVVCSIVVLLCWCAKICKDTKYLIEKTMLILLCSLVFTGPRVDVHGIPAAVGPQPDPEERRPGLMHEHAHQRENILSTHASPHGFQLRCTSSISPIAFPQIFNDELFGAVAEEKEVKGIVSKLMEARHSKSMDSYEVLARFCSKESITKLILPLKEVSKGALQRVFTYEGVSVEQMCQTQTLSGTKMSDLDKVSGQC